jgi:hypothetical protein
MEIRFDLEPVDATDPNDIDPVGTIVLIEGAQRLDEQYVYLDSWLAALLEGAEGLAERDRVEVDLIEEPQPLIFERKQEAVSISFKGKSITVQSAEAVRVAAVTANQRLQNERAFKSS